MMVLVLALNEVIGNTGWNAMGGEGALVTIVAFILIPIHFKIW